MVSTREIGNAGEGRTKEILKTLGYNNIKDTAPNFDYDLVAMKGGAIYHIEVKTRSNTKIFHLPAYTLKSLIKAGNGLIILIRGAEYKIIKAETLGYRLKKGSVVLGLSFDKNYEKLNFCNRCGNVWASDKPLFCSKCKSPYWNKPYKGLGNVSKRISS